MSPVFAPLLLLALGAPSERSLSSERYHVRIDAPAGWTILRQNAYPSMIATMTHKEGGRMTFSAQRAQPGETAEKLAERSRGALERGGLRIERIAPSPLDSGVVEVTGRSSDGKLQMRQLYLIRDETGYVLTLTAPPPKMAQYGKDLEAAWRGITYLPHKSANE